VKDATAPRTSRKEAIVKEAIGLTDVKTLRARARQGIEDGAMTFGLQGQSGYGDHPAERSARNGNRLRPSLQAPLLHGHRDQFPQREDRVSQACR